MPNRSSRFYLLAPSLILASAACAVAPSSEGADGTPSTTTADALRSSCKIKCKNPVECGLAPVVSNLRQYANPTGIHATYANDDRDHLDLQNPFFKSLGTNGRACVSCHTPGDGWSVTPSNLKQRFEDSCGTDPIFRTVDGSNSPTADVSTLAQKKQTYSLLLNKGLIRIERPIPANAEFELVSVDDPYGNSTANGISLFRRPLPATNLKFLNLIMFDGREPDLRTQALNATLGHAEGAAPSSATLDEIVAFETSLFTSQVKDNDTGSTSAAGGKGSPVDLSKETFTFNGNPVQFLPPGTPPDNLSTFSAPPVNQDVFTLYSAWSSTANSDSRAEKRASVERGEHLFNHKFFQIDTIPGLGPLQANCSTCHLSGNTGGSDQNRLANRAGVHTVLTDVHTHSDANRRTADLPLYTFRVKATGEKFQNTDPGAAMVTGKVDDMGAFRSAPLRGLAARAPYIHNGAFATLRAVVDFYEEKFAMGLTEGEKQDLTQFLQQL